MEKNSKRKRSEVRGGDAARISGKKIRAKKEGGCDAAGVTAADDDAEMEEFFAILKRLQKGFNYFQKRTADNCDGKPPAPAPTASRLWKPAFELEDFNHVDHGWMVKTSDGEELRNGAVVGFDLNADPGTD